MTRPAQLNWFHHILRRITATTTGAKILARMMHQLDRPILRLSRGRVSAASLLTGFPVIALTTIGAKSGLSRTVPLLAMPDGERLILIASNWGQTKHPAWYFNLRAHPAATVTRNGQTQRYSAHEAAGAEYDRAWQFAVQTNPGYALYKQRVQNRQIPIIVLDPQG
ncbi:MAG: nitroreductase family deazaflavin-dependent oxidoreductase [Chloroflexales bacterium]|nr:nitroreductase family deazaflavin-dependent oxidoreductase [Chloroflexales bacterium]